MLKFREFNYNVSFYVFLGSNLYNHGDNVFNLILYLNILGKSVQKLNHKPNTFHLRKQFTFHQNFSMLPPQ